MRRLLAHETLTPQQMWWAVMVEHRHDESDPLSDQVPEAVMLIADTREQVFEALAQAGREPWLAVSEAELRDLLTLALPSMGQRLTQKALRATGAPAWWTPVHRYGVALFTRSHDPLAPEAEVSAMTWHWVSAPSAADAIEMLEAEGIRGELSHLVDVQVIMQVLADMAHSRKHRGAGVWSDGRFIGTLTARRRALNVEKHGGEQSFRTHIDALRASLGQPAPFPPEPPVDFRA